MYRTIDAAFWTDSKVRRLDVSGRLLFLYLITNPHTHVSGLYYLPQLIAQHETGMTAKQFKYTSDTLSSFGFCRFDRPNELVWVVKMFRFQGKGEKNTLSAARHLSQDVHNSFLINEFLEAYPEVKPHIKNRVSGFGTPQQEQENGTGVPEQDSAPRKRKTSIDPEFIPDEGLRAWAAKEKFTEAEITDETPQFVDHWLRSGEPMLDWKACWRTWMRNFRKFGKRNLATGGSNGNQNTTRQGSPNPRYVTRQ
jgi:hypothetical protein